MGDAWERGYGKLHWGPLDPERSMPWYMAISNGTDSCRDYSGRRTECFGVEVLPNSFALWSCDTEGVTLVLDLRSGAAPVALGDRVLDCARIHSEIYTEISAFDAVKLRVPFATETREDLHEMQQIVSNGKYSYSAPRTAAGHSDRCTALALAVRAASRDGGYIAPPRVIVAASSFGNIVAPRSATVPGRFK
jgi:hypothetical protein